MPSDLDCVPLSHGAGNLTEDEPYMRGLGFILIKICAPTAIRLVRSLSANAYKAPSASVF